MVDKPSANLLWRMAETAAVLGISRKNLWEKLRKLGIAGEEA